MRCQQKNWSCFACLPEGECNALDDTDCGGGKCSFYKEAQTDYDEEIIFEDCKFIGRFKRVRGFDGKYLVSEYGQVINSHREELTVYYSERNLPYVRLHIWGSMIRIYLAAIVADAWIPGRGKLDFKDHDPTHCTAENIFRR